MKFRCRQLKKENPCAPGVEDLLDAQVSTHGHIACMYKPPHHDTYESSKQGCAVSHVLMESKLCACLWKESITEAARCAFHWKQSRCTCVTHVHPRTCWLDVTRSRNKILTCDCRNLLDGCLCSALLHFTGLQLLISTNWSF
jgi:hypothetical protein